MKLKKLQDLLEATVFTNNIKELDIEYIFSCDLMSDVLMITREAKDIDKKKTMLTTGLATNQSVRTAEMLDVDVICLVRGKNPSDKMISLANETNIIIIGTKLSTFKSNGLLFKAGLNGVEGYVS